MADNPFLHPRTEFDERERLGQPEFVQQPAQNRIDENRLDRPIRELRDLMRYRRKLVESQAAERNRLLKVLETANIKLANVATDVFGMSGRLMLRALIAGKATPQEMAELAKGLLRKKIPELELALEGKLEEHHRFLLELQLERLEAAEKDLASLDNTSGRSLNLMRRRWPCWTRYRVWIGLWPR